MFRYLSMSVCGRQPTMYIYIYLVKDRLFSMEIWSSQRNFQKVRQE